MLEKRTPLNLETIVIALIIGAIASVGILASISAATATDILSWNPVSTIVGFFLLTITICIYILYKR